jgi:hypothetical protein
MPLSNDIFPQSLFLAPRQRSRVDANSAGILAESNDMDDMEDGVPDDFFDHEPSKAEKNEVSVVPRQSTWHLAH